MIKPYAMERLSLERLKSYGANLNAENNKKITETAGFVPLEVKLRRFEENGMLAKFENAEFTSTDYRDIYLNPDLQITPDMELEDIEEIMQQRQALLYQRALEKRNSNSEISEANSESFVPSKDKVKDKEEVKSE